ncbi:MAG TPA: S-methyl-5'-thioadenosine phosphorylase [Caldilineales bacterium]|nr:S-methyl-5'-thioadenosine phosphorylase [Caldilineales bacterium]
MPKPIRIGVIGGSGVYDLPGLNNVEEITIQTPFGNPSDNYIVGDVHGQRVAFLARHGRGHIIHPTALNARANIWGFKSLGVEYLISMNACGSLREEIEPGHIVIPHQLFDRTRLRSQTFFDEPGLVVHVSLADPICPYLADVLYEAVAATGKTVHKGGEFVIIEGPRFSTKSESRVFRQLGFDIIGMTAIPEAFLAREAGMSYAIIAHVTDYDVWHESEEPVTVEMVIKTLLENAAAAQQATLNAIKLLKDAPPSPYADALKDAIITSRDKIPQELKGKYQLLIGQYL